MVGGSGGGGRACRAAPGSRKGQGGEAGAAEVHPTSADGALEGVFCLAVGAVAYRAGVGGRARVGTLATE